MKKEKIRKRKEEPPKVLVQTPSIYSVRVDPKAPQTKEFPKKIMEKLVPYHPLYENQSLILEFELKDFESGIVETFNVPKEHKYYGIYEHMYFSRSPEEIIKDRLSALSNYVGGFLRDLGFNVLAQDIEIDSGKIIVRMKVKRLEKINNALKKYIKSKEIIEETKDRAQIKKERNLITRDKRNGDFYFKNKLIKFENKEAIYYLIFECLYEKGDLNGSCSYETINKYLEDHDKEKYTDRQQILNRIKNGIMNLFRFSDLPQKAPDGKELIQKVRGKRIILYNPQL